MTAALEAIERMALLGAAQDPRIDKSDWVRVWARARQAQGKPADDVDWRDAHHALSEDGDITDG